MCGTENAPRGPFQLLEHRHGLAEIVERDAGVLVECLCVNPPHPVRPGGKLVWATSVARATDDGARVVAGAMRAAGFVGVKIDVTRLQGAARWTPVVGTKAS